MSEIIRWQPKMDGVCARESVHEITVQYIIKHNAPRPDFLGFHHETAGYACVILACNRAFPAYFWVHIGYMYILTRAGMGYLERKGRGDKRVILRVFYGFVMVSLFEHYMMQGDCGVFGALLVGARISQAIPYLTSGCNAAARPRRKANGMLCSGDSFLNPAHICAVFLLWGALRDYAPERAYGQR